LRAVSVPCADSAFCSRSAFVVVDLWGDRDFLRYGVDPYHLRLSSRNWGLRFTHKALEVIALAGDPLTSVVEHTARFIGR
jgi:hypothetical protein